MTYDAQEASAKGGRPYFLYLLTDGTVAGTARLTSHAVELNRMSEDWTPSSVSTSHFEQNGNIEKQELKLAFPLSDTFARRFLDFRSGVTTLTVWRGHLTDVSNELRVIWKGRIVDGEATDDETIELIGESIFTSLRRSGCRTRVQRTCVWQVYRPGCNLVRADFEVAGTVTAVAGSGLVVTVPEAAAAVANDYKNGIIDWNGVTATIVEHFGSTLYLLTEVAGLEDEFDANGPVDVVIAPGCNRGKARCERFDNLINRLAFDYLPKVDPFKSSIT